MAEMALFFESVNGDRRYKVTELVSYLRPFFSDGVFPNPSTGQQVKQNTEADMFVLVQPGDSWINGRMYRIVDDAKRLRIDPSDSATSRIDRIVVGADYANRTITTYVKKGSPASSPQAPELQRDTTKYEICLAEVTIAPGATQITQSAIKDTRLDNAVCGIVTGLVETVDTTTLYNQLETWRLEFMEQKETQLAEWIATFQKNMNDWKTVEQQAFVEWFNGIKGQLNGDIAGNLLNQIEELKATDTTLDNNTKAVEKRVKKLESERPRPVEETILASGWSGNKYSLEAKYPFAQYDIYIIDFADTVTKEQIYAWGDGMIRGSMTENVLTALDIVPKIDVPIKLELVKKGA